MPALKFRVILDNIEDQEIFRDVVVNDDHRFTDFLKLFLRVLIYKMTKWRRFL